MMKRRTFLKITGIAVAGQALGAASVASLQPFSLGSTPVAEAAALPPISSSMRLNLPGPGLYEVSGMVRLHAPQVTIEGITNAQQISWSNISGSQLPLASFSSFETIESLAAMPEIIVQGGEIAELKITPIDFN